MKVRNRPPERWKRTDNETLAAIPITQNQGELPMCQITGNLPAKEIETVPWIGTPCGVSAVMPVPEWLITHEMGFGVPVINQQLVMTCLVLSRGVPRMVMIPSAAGSSHTLCWRLRARLLRNAIIESASAADSSPQFRIVVTRSNSFTTVIL